MSDHRMSIPVPAEPESGSCAWCGTPTRLKLALRKGSNKGAKAIRMEYAVWCCDQTPACKRRHQEAV